jgi:hypothetical protein
MKLEDIPKKNIHQVPDGYFEKLPGMIQAKVTQQAPVKYPLFYPRLALKYTLPVLVLGVLSALWFSRNTTSKDAETILASVQTEHLIEYLADTDLTLDELLRSADFSPLDVNEIENSVYDLQLEDDALENYLDDYEFDLKN